jgi:hypothetical protein
MLYLTMLAMANHRTGELRFRDHWFTGREIDIRAEISDRTRKPLMRELINAGMVSYERERVQRYLKDHLTGYRRNRSVLGHSRYVIVKSPHRHNGSSTVKSLHGARISPTSLSELHQGGAGVAPGDAGVGGVGVVFGQS